MRIVLLSLHLLILVCVCSNTFVLLSSAASTTALFPPGSSQTFSLETTVLLNEPSGPHQGSFVGYQVKGDVLVKVKWAHPTRADERLLQVQVNETNGLHNKDLKIQYTYL